MKNMCAYKITRVHNKFVKIEVPHCQMTFVNVYIGYTCVYSDKLVRIYVSFQQVRSTLNKFT